ncbi:hypothetical protein [Nonomuraea sp. LPB2021202275-12-8]|uniref:hypothetical protein n=1 Tax=Nonomuraea sp. LPB2021202275-12-8 TaxID=3120159 RepID=UPI00300C4084
MTSSPPTRWWEDHRVSHGVCHRIRHRPGVHLPPQAGLGRRQMDSLQAPPNDLPRAALPSGSPSGGGDLVPVISRQPSAVSRANAPAFHA